MIKYSEIKTIFNNAGIDIYDYNAELNEEQIYTPFVVFQATGGDDFGADGVNYLKFLNVTIVMIDETINFVLMSKIEKVFENYDTSFDRSINFDDEQRLYSMSYYISVLNDASNQSINSV